MMRIVIGVVLVMVVSADPTRLFHWGGPGSDEGRFSAISGLDYSDGKVYVADLLNNRVQVLWENGTFIQAWEGPEPASVQVCGDDVFVSFGSTLVKFDKDGNRLTEWKSPAAPQSTFVAIACSEDKKEVYVTDTLQFKVWVFDRDDGQVLRSIGSKGDKDGQFLQPQGIIFKNGFVYVADSTNWNFQRFTGAGEFEDGWGGPRVEPFISVPVEMDLFKNVLFVAAYGNNMVFEFDLNGKFWKSFNVPEQPHGLAIDGTRVAISFEDRDKVEIWDISSEVESSAL